MCILRETAWKMLSCAVMSHNIRQTDGSPVKGNLELTSLVPRPSLLPVFDRLQYRIKNWRPENEASIDQSQQNMLPCKHCGLQTLFGHSLASQTHFCRKRKSLVNCLYKPCPAHIVAHCHMTHHVTV